jgi:hypothetical protein
MADNLLQAPLTIAQTLRPGESGGGSRPVLKGHERKKEGARSYAAVRGALSV